MGSASSSPMPTGLVPYNGAGALIPYNGAVYRGLEPINQLRPGIWEKPDLIKSDRDLFNIDIGSKYSDLYKPMSQNELQEWIA
jgi:hypothetical protein